MAAVLCAATFAPVRIPAPPIRHVVDDDEGYLSDLVTLSDLAAASDVATQALAVATRPPPTVAAAPAADVHPRATRGGTRDHMSWMRYGKLRNKVKNDSLKQAIAIASFADKISTRVPRGFLTARQALMPMGLPSKGRASLGFGLARQAGSQRRPAQA